LETGRGRLEVAGAGGCEGGWIVQSTFKHPLSGIWHCAAVAVNTPIGLTDSRQARSADRPARTIAVLSWECS
jgi:hypothetical protein